MKYLYMNPTQIRDAIKRRIPVVLPIGVIEYHAEHLPVGVDFFVAEKVIDTVEQERPNDVVVLPPFYYGTATTAVAAPENNGTINVRPEKIIPVAEEIFRGLLTVGFRNIHCFVAHQTEEFYQGMPTDLAFRFAGRRAIFAFLERTKGRGWWGNPAMKDYYLNPESNYFDWIQIHTNSGEFHKVYPGDHAGKAETSEIMALYPELVHMDKMVERDWFAADAVQATREFGEERLNASVLDLEKTLKM